MNKKAVILFFPATQPEGYDVGFPWALLHLERMIRDLDVELLLIDERLEKDYEPVIQNTKGRLLFAGVSAILGYQVVGGMKFSKAIKSITGAPVIWGGWFPTVYPEMALKEDCIDYVCVGQGEIPFKSFTERILNQEEVTSVAGIGYKKDGEITINSNESIINPYSFPPIDKSLIDVNKLIDNNGIVPYENRIFSYIASYGCPINCSFCCVSLIYKNKWFSKQPLEIIEDLKYFTEKASISQFLFADDNFFGSKKFVLDFCQELINSGLEITWSAQAQVRFFLKHFSDADIRLIYKSGCRRIIVGAESGDQETLDVINKKIDLNETYQILKLLKGYDIRNRIHAMVCLPINPEKDFWQTMNMVGNSILIDPSIGVSIKFYKPIPKTDLYEICIKKGFNPPSTIHELIDSLFEKNVQPWHNKDYHRLMKYFVNFYFVFANPNSFMAYPLKYRPLMFVLTLIFHPPVYLRIKLNWMKFPFEAWLFMKIIPTPPEATFVDTKSINKTKFLRIFAEK
jgi:radical SAM superfamily enzyme YgiQ (UPF0313 family)